MPNFSFKPKRLPNKKKYVVISDGKILEKNVEGVIHVRMNGTFYVHYNNYEYVIHPDCWDTKGVQRVYSRRLVDGKRWSLIRAIEDGLPRMSPKNFLPWAPGCAVIGNVVLNERINTLFFKIKKVLNYDKNNEEAKEASKFFRTYWKEIFGQNE